MSQNCTRQHERAFTFLGPETIEMQVTQISGPKETTVVVNVIKRVYNFLSPVLLDILASSIFSFSFCL